MSGEVGGDLEGEVVALLARGENSAAAEAVGLQEDLSRIEREITVNIYYVEHGQRPGGGGTQEFQAGTAFAPGGLALVGEGGPELAVLPRGTAVMPAWETRQVLRQDNRRAYDQRRYQNTIVVKDTLAAAMILEERRREVRRGVERSM